MKLCGQGMVTSVGLRNQSSCAAIRCALTGFRESRFMFAGDWILTAAVPLPGQWTGARKLVEMAAMVIRECTAGIAVEDLSNVALLLCIPERDRPGRLPGLDESLFERAQATLRARFHPESVIVAGGKIGGATALQYARKLLDGGLEFCIVAGVDSLLSPQTLAALDERRLLLTAANSDGMIPGEAAAALLLQRTADTTGYSVLGVGTGRERASLDSGEPLRGEGLTEAFRRATDDAGLSFADIDYRLSDANGIQYGFKEGTLALARCLRPVRPEFEVWTIADCIGEIGAATIPAHIAYARQAFAGGFAPGRTAICHFSDLGSERAAVVLGPVRGSDG